MTTSEAIYQDKVQLRYGEMEESSSGIIDVRERTILGNEGDYDPENTLWATDKEAVDGLIDFLYYKLVDSTLPAEIEKFEVDQVKDEYQGWGAVLRQRLTMADRTHEDKLYSAVTEPYDPIADQDYWDDLDHQ